MKCLVHWSPWPVSKAKSRFLGGILCSLTIIGIGLAQSSIANLHRSQQPAAKTGKILRFSGYQTAYL
ncbi:hypothetical protein AWM79_06835 [Pseudomonas agarici]|uniref:Uncharacterized protein n=1 Tax=Pseudomonas agarici TaxID=46677 RepID=A0A0X1SZ31_PSEAA|nr:hypothetical protein AWM79_06835 [Pseudomonas agarici]